tara:strand:+ start:3273 stop:4265 length:993 start_codon:yes stop_codon:yes gene_type:complete
MLKKLIFPVFIFVFILLVLEILLRVFSPLHFTGPIEAYEYDKKLGVKAKKNLNLIKVTDHRQEYITNSLGTFNFENDFNNYDKIIFTIGDSITQGTGVEPTSSYPFNLFLNLNTDNQLAGKTFGVINLGLAAFGFEQSFIATKLFFEKMKPDYIVFVGVGNDERDDHLFLTGYRHNHLVDGSPRFFGLGGYIGWIANNFEVLKRLKLIISKLRYKNIFKNTKIAYDKSSVNFDKYEKLKKFANLNNIDLMLTWYHCQNEEINNYKNLKIWSEDNNVKFIDWCNDFKEITSILPNLPTANNHSSGHHRPWVYKIIADNAAELIKKNEIYNN